MVTATKVVDLYPLQVWVDHHGRSYDFSEFQNFGKFAVAVAGAFGVIARRQPLKTTSSVFPRFISLLRFIHKDDRAASLRDQLEREFERAEPELWIAALLEWRSTVAVSDVSNRTKDNTVSYIRPLLRHLADHGVIPQIGNVLIGFSYDPNPKRSLGDVTSGLIQDRDIQSDGESAQSSFIEDQIESQSVLSIASDLSRKVDQTDHDKIPGLVLSLLKTRLSAIRYAAESELLVEYKNWKHGQSLIENCDLDARELLEQYLQCKSGKDLRIFFPNSEIGLARLLSLYKNNFEGIRPSYSESQGRGLSEIENQFGGADCVYSFLHASRKFINSVLVIVLIDTACNVESARTLTRDCMSPWIDSEINIRMYKRRAGPHSIQNYKVPRRLAGTRVGVVDAIEWTKEATEQLATFSKENDEPRFANFLFLCASRAARTKNTNELVRLATGRTFLGQFNEFKERIGSESSEFLTTIRLKTFRPALLLKEALETKSIVAVQNRAKHSSTAMAFKYVRSIPLSIQGRDSIRRFMEALQVLTTIEIQHVCELLNIDKDSYESVKKSLWDTGLGVYCKNPMEGLQRSEGFGPGKQCGAIDKCIECKNCLPIIVASPSNIAHLVVWKRHLEAQKKQFPESRADRWNEVWEPWLVFAKTALEKVSSPLYRSAYAQALAIAEASCDVFPDLW